MNNIKTIVVASLLGTLIAAPLACSKSNEAAPAELTTGLGESCERPLPIAGTVALKPFPDGKDFLALSGAPDEAIVEGGVGLVRDGAHGHALAINVGGKPVTIPDSAGALDVHGAALPGTDLKLVVFSRTRLTARAAFGGKVLNDVDPSKWSLELRVLDATVKVVAARSLPFPNESVVPLDIKVKGPAGTAKLLLQVDRRPVPGLPVTSNDQVSMQIVDLRLTNDVLDVDQHPREAVTEREFRYLTDLLIPPPICPGNACGPIVDGHGREIQCGGCLPDEECNMHLCRPLTANKKCTPKTHAELCGAGACGKKYDGCTAIVDCGGCSDGKICGRDKPNTCADPTVVTPADVRATFGGTKVCGCFLAEYSKVVDVHCEPKESCKSGVCVAN